MADKADGSIIVDTELDTEGFKAGSSDLQRAIKSLNTKVESLGPTFQKALSGNEKAISTFNSKADTLENTITDIEEKMGGLGNLKIPTEEYTRLCSEVEKAEQALFKLYNRREKMEELGTNQDSNTWKSLQYDIENAEAALERLENRKSAMETNGTALQSGVNTAQYQQLSQSLTVAKNKLSQLRTEAEATNNSTSRLGAVGNFVKSAFTGIGNVGKAALTGIGSALKNGIAKMRQFAKQSNKASYSMRTMSGRMKMMVMMIKQMLVMRAFMGILTAVGDGFKNLSQYSKQTNADLSALKSALTQLKNSFASAFAPILTVVTPALTALINKLSQALTVLGKFVAAMTGAKTFTKAVAVQEDYAASLENTGKAAEKSKKQLAGFDELNVLSDNSSDSGGSAGSASPSEMFEEVPIESSITDFVDRLKQYFAEGDWAGLGELIGTGINTAVQKVNDFIKWDSVGAKITSGMKNAASCFNALVDTVDWENIGDTLAQGLNTALNMLYLVITEFDWPGLAAGFARSLNGLVSGFDWSRLGQTLSTGFITILATLRTAITTFDWVALGKGIADAINNIDWPGILSNIAGFISDLVSSALDLLIGFAENLNWAKLGTDLWNSFVGVITSIKWSDLISKAFQILGAALAGAVSLIVGLCQGVWDSLKAGFEATKEYFSTYIEEAGGNIVEGIFNGIVNALKSIGTWIIEHIWNPFIEGFKAAFGINSPSVKMAEMGGYIVEGFLKGITDVWYTVIEFFASTFTEIATTISTKWTEIKTEASQKWTEIKTDLSQKWTEIKTTASTKWSELKNTVSTKWAEIKTSTSQKWTEIKTDLTQKWTEIKTTASTKWSELKTTISTKWAEIKTDTTQKWSSIKTAVSQKWDEIKTTASTKWSSLKSTISTGWNNIKSATSTTWSTIKSTLSQNWDSIKSTASTKWDSIKSTINNKGWSSVGSNICSGISTGLNNGWTWLKNTVGNLASSLLTKAKEALGIHSPSTLFRDMVGLNIGYGIGEGIEASEGSVLSSVTGLADAIANEANAGEYGLGSMFTAPEVDTALTGFSDKIVDGFSAMLDRLQTIADRVTFAMPLMATGKVIPYQAASQMPGAFGVNNSESDSGLDVLVADIINSNLAGQETIVGVLREILEAMLGIQIGDDVIGSAVQRYNRKQAMMMGGGA